MNEIPLTLAISRYDHVEDLTAGRVVPEGIRLTALSLPIEEIFFRFLKHREWDVSELSFAKYASLISQGDRSLTAIPVFPSRIFRHSSVYVRRDGPVQSPTDLAGKRIGIPEWAQTAAVYSRGFLKHQYGVDLKSIDWIQAGVNEPGRGEKVKLDLPEGIRLTPAPTKSLSQMLVEGEVDAVLTAHAPDCFEHGHPNVRRLFEDYMAVEADYYRTTGIFPIMHVVALKRDVVDTNPWVAMSLLKAFEEAKRRSVARALEVTAPRFPIPWCFEHARRAQDLFGEDHWPYGVDANRTTLEAFLKYAHEQGVCHRLLTPEDLFPSQVLSRFRI
ncbi:4,5-dihydroxyphthalate decarboxylase [Aliidongia dinghuensis]|uniref:4,5-dihydroxyphthalate decarboxylase n=1 Tax=Aliidongia dinghuensis TaxID=1867774 RepID=A0A8J3E2L9_9PROT|nr:4,5-dihydroxyphthalate decarboxylase [Aliidongia dinghuensis]GGF11399.1 4,5-dihydroxyphthalate decarboxylase [Aliidongia dinghuensis]